jgi:hypothetical protein
MLSMVVCALVNPGNFGTSDTLRRLHVERWIRLGEPPVHEGDRAHGLKGRNGLLHPEYGIGQSLLLLPFDAAVGATVVPVLNRLGTDAARQQQVVELLVAFLMQWFVTACTLALAYEVLLSFQFAPFAAMAGTMALLFGTSCLQYVQCAQENNLILLLALGALCALRWWQNGKDARWATVAGMACGCAILVRLPSVLQTAVLPMVAGSAGNRRKFLAGFLPPVAAAVLLDRWYHWYRFGELFSTYTGIVGRQLRQAGAPASFPFSYPFWKGFSGALFSPDKSIFLFDPLLVVLLLVAAWKWRSIPGAVRGLLLWLTVLLLLYMAFYATYYDFGGDVAWGHRFLTLPVQLLCLFAVPLLVTFANGLPSLPRRATWAAVCASIVLQEASTTMAPSLEVIHRDEGSHHSVLGNRAVNLSEVALGRENGPRFRGVPNEWRTLYYLPFQLRLRFPGLAVWAIAAWMALLLAALPVLAFTAMRNAARWSGDEGANRTVHPLC